MVDEKSLKTRALWTLGLNVFFLTLCLGFGGIHLMSVDDYFMSAIITGAYGGQFDAHTLFVNGAYAYFLKPFYNLFPKIGWYFIFEMLGVFASFCVLTSLILKKIKGFLGVVIAVLILACLTPDFYLQLNFTQCAAAMTAAGILLVAFGNANKKWTSLVLGSLFLVAGIAFRKEGFLLGIPFLLFLFGANWLWTRRIWLWTLLAMAVCACAYFALQSFNQNLFKNNEYSYYMNYQWPRSTFGDGTNYSSQNTFDELGERGMQGRDFDLLERWIYYDTRVFSLDSLKPITEVVQRNRYELNYAKMPIALFLVVAKSFFNTKSWCWAVLCFILFFFVPKRAGLYTWGSLALIALCLSYLLMLNRVVSHVEAGIWLYAIFCAAPFMPAKKEFECRSLGRFSWLLALLSVGCFVFAFSSTTKIKNDRVLFGNPKMSSDLQSFVDYSEHHPDDVFLLYFGTYKELATYRNPAYKAVKPNSWNNLIPIGYWNINLPAMKAEMHKRGVENPLGDIVKDNVYVVERGRTSKFQQFYKTHYHTGVNIDTVKQFGSINLLKYRAIEAEND